MILKTLDSLDSEVIQLIEDLGLVQIGSPAFAAHIVALTNSRYSHYWFCERVLDLQRQKELDKQRFLSELFKRNRKYSRYKPNDLLSSSCARLPLE